MDFIEESPKLIRGILKKVKSDLKKKSAKDKSNINSSYLRGSLVNLKKTLELIANYLPKNSKCNSDFSESIVLCSEALSATLSASLNVMNEPANCVRQMKKDELLNRFVAFFNLDDECLHSSTSVSGTSKPSKHKELLSRIDSHYEQIRSNTRSESFRVTLLNKLSPLIDRIDRYGPRYGECNKVDKLLKQWISNGHRERDDRIVDLFRFVDEEFLNSYSWCDEAHKIFNSVRKPGSELELKADSRPKSHNPDVETARGLVKGMRLVVLSMNLNSRNRHAKVLKSEFDLSTANVPSITNEDNDWKKYRRFVNKADLVIFAVGKLRHQISEHLRNYCNDLNIKVLFLPKNCGLNPARLAPLIIENIRQTKENEMKGDAHE